jgi:hypothetical protein
MLQVLFTGLISLLMQAGFDGNTAGWRFILRLAGYHHRYYPGNLGSVTIKICKH